MARHEDVVEFACMFEFPSTSYGRIRTYHVCVRGVCVCGTFKVLSLGAQMKYDMVDKRLGPAPE